MFDYRNTSFEIKDGQPKLAILPVASIEQHGSHLPLATDLLIMNAIAEQVAPRLDGATFRLPTFPYGTSMYQSDFAGTLWLTADTLFCVIRDVIESLYEHGITRVVVLNNHGGANGTTVVPRGNFVVKSAVRQMNYDHPDCEAIWVQPLAAARIELMGIFETAGEEFHAGEIETSLLLHLHEELVKGRAEDFVPEKGGEYLDFVPFQHLCPGGVWGYPSRANAETGKRALEAAVDGTVRYIVTTLAQLDEAKGSRV